MWLQLVSLMLTRYVIPSVGWLSLSISLVFCSILSPSNPLCRYQDIGRSLPVTEFLVLSNFLLINWHVTNASKSFDRVVIGMLLQKANFTSSPLVSKSDRKDVPNARISPTTRVPQSPHWLGNELVWKTSARSDRERRIPRCTCHNGAHSHTQRCLLKANLCLRLAVPK